ncbi:MAG: hypothetical protein K1X75_11120 [Leptospirales bacterium]|nr:hypothetical protein [Leptospirales bacterium]
MDNERMLVYRLADVPDDYQLIEEIELTVKWETALSEDAGNQSFTGIDELNQLLRQRVERILSEKQARCARVVHETVTHTTNYGAGARVMLGQYRIDLFAPTAPVS